MEGMRAKHGCRVDVGEVDAPSQVVTVAEAAGLREDFFLDLVCPRANGFRWGPAL